MTSLPADFSKRAALVVGLLATFASRQPVSGQQASGPDTVALTPSDPVSRTIAANDQQSFELALEPGQAVKVTVDQAGADVILTLRAGSTGDAITADEEAKHHYGRERLVWMAPAAGAEGSAGGPVRVTVTVRATKVVDASSGYTLTAFVYEPSEILTRAVRSLEDGLRLMRDGTPASLDEALTALRQAAEAWREIGDREMAGESLYRLGRMQAKQLNRPADAVATLTASLALFDELPLADDSAKTLVLRGDTRLYLSDIDEARADYEKAYTHAAALDPIVRAIIIDDQARVFQRLAEFDRALEYGHRAIDAFRAAGARRDEAIALERLANVYERLRRHDEALAALTEALTLGRQYASQTDVATMHASLGSLHQASGDDESAVASYRTSIAMYPPDSPTRLGPTVAMARSLNRMGESGQARQVLEEALAATPPQHKEYWAALANELGVTLTTQGEPARALELQRKAQEIVQAGKSRMGELVVMRDIAATYRALGDLEGARKAIDRAEQIASTVPGRPYAGILLRERARIARQAGDLAQARTLLDQAIEMADSYRSQVQAQALRTAYSGGNSAYFEEGMTVAMEMHARAPQDGHDGRAFEIFERSLGRSLTELLSEARVDLRPGVDAALLAEQRRLQEQLGKKDTELRTATGKPGAPDRAAIESQIDDVSRQLTILDGRIRAANPRYAAITRPTPLSIAEAQRLLDADTVLLAFYIGAKSSWGWAITSASVRSFALPSAVKIEERARKVYADLTVRQRRERPMTGTQVAEIDAALTVDSAELSDMILGPVAASLQGEWKGRRLAIIPTGALEYVPFAALPAPVVAPASGASASAAPILAGGAPRPWLVDTHEIVRLPSMSALALLRNETATRPAASHTIAVLADPVYSTDDPRVRARFQTRRERDRDASPRDGGVPAASLVSRTSSAPVTTLASAAFRPQPPPTRSLLRGTSAGETQSGFARLVFSREEAQAIVKLARAGEAFEALDFAASRATMASPAVANAGIIHIATHGILNSARPELSGLVLSLVDERGQPQDGVLRLYDIFNLKLSADLVVLSGCQTGLGRQMNGEGLVGLTRGFMHAGVPRLVTSLWQVDDLATAELMRRFYRGLIVQQLSPAAALRQAQREMRANPRWQSPFYWAAFTLIGDWR